MKFRTQFFATPEELTDLLRELKRQTKLDMISKSQAGSVSEFDPDGFDEFPTRIFFGHFRPVPNSDEVNTLDFERNWISLQPGRSGTLLDENGLHESFVSNAGDNQDISSMARKVQSILRKATKAGVVFRNPNTGAEGVSKFVRYTEGARALSIQGTPLVPVAGHNRGRVLD